MVGNGRKKDPLALLESRIKTAAARQRAVISWRLKVESGKWRVDSQNVLFVVGCRLKKTKKSASSAKICGISGRKIRIS
jgi:hypothetical protein